MNRHPRPLPPLSLFSLRDERKETRALLLLCTLFLEVLSPRIPKHFSDSLHAVSRLRVVMRTADGTTCLGTDGRPCRSQKQNSKRLLSCCSSSSIASAGKPVSWVAWRCALPVHFRAIKNESPSNRIRAAVLSGAKMPVTCTCRTSLTASGTGAKLCTVKGEEKQTKKSAPRQSREKNGY